MKFYFTITSILFGLATVTNAVTSPITEMELREYRGNIRYQSARQKLFKSGHHRTGNRQKLQPGTALSLKELLKQLKTARKTAEKRRKDEKAAEKQRKLQQKFYRMLQITNGYKNGV